MDAFNITGWGFIAPLLVVTGLVFVAAILLPPRLARRGRSWRAYLVQALALVLVAVLSLLSVGALMNKDNNWYTSWDEILSGPDLQAAPDTTDYGEQPAAATAGKQPQQTASDLQAHPEQNPQFGSALNRGATGGQYVSFDYTGPTTRQTYGMMVWLPASYLSHPDRFYPVILGFTGFPGSPETYSQSVDYGKMIEQTVSAGKMREAIFVVPNVSPGVYDSECVDGTQSVPGMGTPKAESYVTQDVVPWIRENLRAIDSPQAWATEGYSAGGWCSTMLSMRHPDLFGSAMNQSGYFSPIYTKGQEWTPASDPDYDLARLAREQAPDVNLYYFSSTDDTLSWPAAQAFSRAVRQPTSLSVNTVPNGGHRLDVWLPGMTHGLAWLGRTSPYFAPESSAGPTPSTTPDSSAPATQKSSTS